jgi:Anti-sigma-K factor rskA
MSRAISEDEQMLAAGYVLEDLSISELAEFELRLANDTVLQAEVRALRAAFNQIPQELTRVVPPPPLKAKILESFRVASISNAELQSVTLVDPVKKKQNSFPWTRVLLALGLLVSGLLAFDNFRLRKELEFTQQVKQQDLANILQQPKSRLVALSDQENRSVGTILFTPGKWQKVIVSFQNLPPLPVDQVYRMWLELKNGQVLPCGEFTTDRKGNVFVNLNAKQDPPKGVKAKGVFVTIDRANSPLTPAGTRLIQGTI